MTDTWWQEEVDNAFDKWLTMKDYYPDTFATALFDIQHRLAIEKMEQDKTDDDQHRAAMNMITAYIKDNYS